MNQRYTLLIVIAALFLSGFSAIAQTASDSAYCIVSVLENTPGVEITQPAVLTQRLVKVDAATSDNATGNGVSAANRSHSKNALYRIEAFADNSRQAKTQATARLRNLRTRFPQYPAQLVFESPFWRVKVGEFRSRGDAEAVMSEIKQAFPSYSPYLRIVRN